MALAKCRLLGKATFDGSPTGVAITATPILPGGKPDASLLAPEAQSLTVPSNGNITAASLDVDVPGTAGTWPTDGVEYEFVAVAGGVTNRFTRFVHLGTRGLDLSGELTFTTVLKPVWAVVTGAATEQVVEVSRVAGGEAVEFGLTNRGGREVREYTTSQSGIPTPAGILGAYTTLVSGASGSGSGSRGAPGTVRVGGGSAGAGGHLIEYWVPASLFGPSYNVVVGAGGSGGAAVTTDNTAGNTGGNGGSTRVDSGTFILNAVAGGPGGSGTAGWAGDPHGQGGVAPSGSGGPGTSAGTYTNMGAGRGGPGGGITSSNVAGAGGSGGASAALGTPTAAGGIVGGSVPAVGYPGLLGGGGGGGAGSTTGPAQAGAPGGFPGGSGGGGGASGNGFASGAGGDGADGYARITFIY